MMKIGVMTPTYKRPMQLRTLALHLERQTWRPHVWAVYQNSGGTDYRRMLQDISLNVAYEYTEEKGDVHTVYIRPLEMLLERECDFFFWCDDDDICYKDHIETAVRRLIATNTDYTVNCRTDMIKVVDDKCVVHWDMEFKAHASQGVSSSMAFSRRFAIQLLSDLKANVVTRTQSYSDEVVGRITLPKFPHIIYTGSPTTMYVCHPQSYSSAGWLTDLK